MNKTEWQRHKDVYCNRCKSYRRCGVRKMMDADPHDPWCQNLFIRLGYCSQYEQIPSSEKQPRKRR